MIFVLFLRKQSANPPKSVASYHFVKNSYVSQGLFIHKVTQSCTWSDYGKCQSAFLEASLKCIAPGYALVIALVSSCSKSARSLLLPSTLPVTLPRFINII